MRIAGERAQFSLEGVLVVGMAIIVFLSLSQLVIERKSMAIDVGESGEVRMIGELVVSAIDNVYANGNGSMITLTSADLDYTYLEDELDVSPYAGGELICIDTLARSLFITKTMTRTGGSDRRMNISFIPSDVATSAPHPNCPETTFVNDGERVVICSSKIRSAPC